VVLLFGVVEPVEEQLRSDAKLQSRPDMVQRMHTGLPSSHYSNNVLFLVSCQILWGQYELANLGQTGGFPHLYMPLFATQTKQSC